jgi:uncharacterized OB-fold protein
VHVSPHVAFTDAVPYTVVAAELDEGVRIFGRLLGPRAEIGAGMRVSATFYESGSDTLLGFALADGDDV